MVTYYYYTYLCMMVLAVIVITIIILNHLADSCKCLGINRMAAGRRLPLTTG